MLNKFGIAVLLLVVAGAAPPAPAIAADKFANIHKIGIVVFTNERIELLRLGPLAAFNRQSSELEIPNWKLNEQVSGWIKHALSPRFEATVLPTHIPSTNCSGAEDCAKAILPDADVDAYVVVFPDTHGSGTLMVGGIGVLHQETIFGTQLTDIHTFLGAYVFDGKTRRRIAHGDPGIPVHDVFQPMPAAMVVENELWSPQAGAYTPAQIEVIKARMTRLVAIAVTVALADTELIPPITFYKQRSEVYPMIRGDAPMPYFADAPNPPPGPSPALASP